MCCTLFRGFVCIIYMWGPISRHFTKIHTLAQTSTPHCTIISLASHSAIILAMCTFHLARVEVFQVVTDVCTHPHTPTHTHIHTHTCTCIHPTNTRNSHTQNTHMYREEGLPQYLPEIAIQPVTFINYNRTVSMDCYK